jgi:hypothetical protein
MPSRLGNFFISALVRSPLHPLLGGSFAVISLRGRRSGRRISTPINVLRDGDALMVVSMRARTWWRNLRSAEPAWLRLAGNSLTVRGEVIEDPDQVGEGLTRYISHRPGDAKYFGVQLRTDGSPSAESLSLAARERVIIRLRIV